MNQMRILVKSVHGQKNESFLAAEVAAGSMLQDRCLIEGTHTACPVDRYVGLLHVELHSSTNRS
jgi:hypothetical protein